MFAFSATLVVLYLGRERWIAPLVIERVARVVREETGLELTVDRLGGDWWSTLEVEGLTLAGEQPHEALQSLSVARLTLVYDLRTLLRGDLAGLASVRLDGASARLDFGARSNARATPDSGAPGAFEWPAVLPRLELSGGELQIALGPGEDARIRGLSLASVPPRPGETGARFALSAASAEYASDAIGDHAARVELALGTAGGVFELDDVRLDGARVIEHARLDLSGVARGEAGFSGALDAFGGRQEFRGEVGPERLSVFVDTETLELGRLLAFLGVTVALDGVVDVAGVVDVPLDAPCGFRVHAWGGAEPFVFDGRRVDRLEVAGSLEGGRLALGHGAAWQGANALRVEDFGLDLSRDGLDQLVRSLRGAVEVELFEPAAILGAAPDEVVRAAERVESARLALDCSPFGFDVRSGEVLADVGRLSVRRGTFDFGALDIPWYRGLLVDVDADLAFADLAPLAALFGRGDVRGSLTGSASVTGAALSPSGRFALAGERLSIAGWDLGSARVEASADSRRLELARLSVDGPLGELAARGGYVFESGEIQDLSVTGETRALGRLGAGRVDAAFAAFDAEVDGDRRDPRIVANARAWSLVLSDGPGGEPLVLEALEAEGAWSAGEARIASLFARVEGVDVEATGVVRPRADASQGAGVDLRLESARLSRDELDLALQAPLEIAAGDDGLALRGLSVAGSAGTLSGELSWGPTEQRGTFRAERLAAQRLLEPFLPAGLTLEGVEGRGSFARDASGLAAEAAFGVRELALFPGAPPASLDLEGKLAGGRLALERAALTSPGRFGLLLRGFAPLTDPTGGTGGWLGEGPIALTGEANLSDLDALPPALRERLRGFAASGSASFAFTGTTSDVRGNLGLSLRLTPPPDAPLFAEAGVESLGLELAAELGEELALRSARLSIGSRGAIDAAGRLAVRLDPRGWLAGGAPDWRTLPLALEARLEAADLGFVAELSRGLRRTAGTLTGSLAVGGTLGAPDLSGTLALDGGELRLANALAPFEKLAARLELERDRLRVVSLTGEFAAAPFSAAGTVELAGGEPNFDLEFHGQGILLAREEGLRLRADADLQLRGPLEGLGLSGAVTLVEGRFSQDFELVTLPGERPARRRDQLEMPFLRRAPWSNVEFDVAVRAKKPIRVETNIARGTIEPRLQLRGNGAAPRLDGTLVIGPSRVKLPAASLEVTSGILTFGGEASLVPRLDITAATRVRGFDITAQVGGTSAEPELLFTSSPPLASEELAVLVLTGQLPESALSAQGSEAAVQTVAVYLGRDLLTRWLGADEDSEDPLAERIEFYRGADVSQTGVESTELVFRLTPNPKGKRRLLYLRAEQDVHEHVNFGFKILFRFR